MIKLSNRGGKKVIRPEKNVVEVQEPTCFHIVFYRISRKQSPAKLTLDKKYAIDNNEFIPMKITLYTITDCQFSKQEKEYLTAHTLQFEEKNLETNREFLTEMLAVSNNFAGTPVTKVEKDDGSISVLKGFTKEEFDKLLGFADAKPAQAPEPAAAPVETPAAAVPQQPVAPPVPEIPVSSPVAQPVAPAPQAPVAPAPVDPTPVMPQAPDPMAGVLENLQQQVNAPATPPAPDMPTIPDPKL